MKNKRQIKLFSLGYQSKSLQNYIDVLVASKVSIVLDVREKAWSYKPGFSKGQLDKALAAAGITYLHIRSAGNPSSNRKTATSVEECLMRYRDHLHHNPECLDEMWEVIEEASQQKKAVCLTCFELEHEQCHRSILIEGLMDKQPRLQPVHLK